MFIEGFDQAGKGLTTHNHVPILTNQAACLCPSRCTSAFRLNDVYVPSALYGEPGHEKQCQHRRYLLVNYALKHSHFEAGSSML